MHSDPFQNFAVRLINELAKFPTPPLYQINEEVYRIVPDQAAPAGPYIVTAILDNRQYKIKRKDNGQEHSQPVEETDIVIPAPTSSDRQAIST